MTGLSNEFVQEMKHKLLEEEKSLKTRIDELKVQDPFQDPEHVNDNAAVDNESREEEGHDRIVAQLDELTAEYEAVSRALERIANGTYGVCSVGQELMNEDRLKIYPTAETCVEHANR